MATLFVRHVAGSDPPRFEVVYVRYVATYPPALLEGTIYPDM